MPKLRKNKNKELHKYKYGRHLSPNIFRRDFGSNYVKPRYIVHNLIKTARYVNRPYLKTTELSL